MKSTGDIKVPVGAKPDKAAADILAELRSMGSEKNRTGMARYGIKVENAFGVSVYQLRKVAKRLGNDHALALALWATGNHEARLLACFVDDPTAVTERQLEAWARDFDSWDICDQATTSLFDLSAHAWGKAVQWAARDEEWVRRAGFTLMAGLAVHDKSATDQAFCKLLPVIARGAWDPRNFVKKAVNWALRQIGKRNPRLRRAAIAEARRIRRIDSSSARWIAADALRELAGRSSRRPILGARRGRRIGNMSTNS
jgi:3-methyladenine DNA glycosylase AlkD